MSGEEERVAWAERRVEALLAGEPASAADRARIAEDPELARLEDELHAVARGLDAVAAPEPPRALVAATVRRSRAELAAGRQPGSLAREWARLGGAAAVTLPLVLAWNAAVLLWLPPLLERFIPGALASALPALYVFGAAGWLALLTVSLPALAQRSLARRHREALG